MRLLVAGDKIFADFHHNAAHWEVKELNLKVNEQTSEFKAELTSSLASYDAQNIAMIHYNNTLYGFWWGRYDGHDTRIIPKHIGEKTDFGERPKGGSSESPHNSGHPLYIPEWNKYLVATHFSTGSNGKHGFQWHSEYFQQFTLLDADPPFRATKRTKPFCFPSPHDNSKCEVIQYAGGWIQDPQDENKLLISLGVNDCKAAYVKIPFKSILDHMEDVSTSEASGITLVKIEDSDMNLVKI